MKEILVLNGPNLNLLGKREPEIYGSLTLAEIDERVAALAVDIGILPRFVQSNVEGVLVDELHAAMRWAEGAIFNAGAYTHSSIALRDAIAAVGYPVIEVHLSNTDAREEFRRVSMIGPVCVGTVKGFGWRSYTLALRALAELIGEGGD
ncbi:MAG: type II 3-dehydroquinate dehydratase [Spirochaetaceae bacterium]|nr:type II 3-dehydroquinate dehydratase [Spirochaetaceae bacterium]